MNILQYRIKQVYGKDMVYPANEVAQKFAALLGVKTFNETQLHKILDLGFEAVRVF